MAYHSLTLRHSPPAKRSGARMRSLTCLWLAWVCLFHSGALAADNTRETQVKAAFLYNFTKFVEWPSSSFDAALNTLMIGVAGDERMSAELEATVRDRLAGDRTLQVKTISSPAEAGQVHVLFVGDLDRAELADWLLKLSDKPVLTVGDSDAFSQLGGMITFVREQDKIRFNINIQSANEANLKISSQLLKLAKEVEK